MIPTVALAMRAAFGPSPGALLSCCLLFALWPPIGTAAANEVTDWNVIIEQTAKASSVKPGVTFSGRNVALMHLAMHDALNSISRRHDSYGVHRSSRGGHGCGPWRSGPALPGPGILVGQPLQQDASDHSRWARQE